MRTRVVSASGAVVAPGARTVLGIRDIHSKYVQNECGLTARLQERTTGRVSNLSKASWLVSCTARIQSQQNPLPYPCMCLGSEIPVR